MYAATYSASPDPTDHRRAGSRCARLGKGAIQILKKGFAGLALALSLAAPAAAATHYINNACANNGNGSANSCASSGGGVGAWNNITNIVCASLSPADHIQVRAGTYRTVWQPVTGCSGTAGNPIVLENFAGEDVIYDGTTDIHGSTWTSVGGGVYNCTGGTCGTGQPAHRVFAAWYSVSGGAEEHLTMVTGAAVTACTSALAIGQISYSSQGGPVCAHLFEGISPADVTVNYFRIPTEYCLIDFANASSVSYVTVRKNPSGGTFNFQRTSLYAFQTTSHNTNITLDGLDIGYIWDRCISNDEGFGNVSMSMLYQNLHVHHCGQEGIRLGNDQAGGQILNSEIDHIQTVPDFPFCPNGGTCEISDHGAAIRLAATAGTIVRGNNIHDVGGGQFGKSSGIDVEVGNTSQLIENNYIWNMNTGVTSTPIGQTEGAAFLFQPFTTADTQSGTWRNNRMWLVDYCFEFQPDQNMLVGTTINIYNNTCIDPTFFGLANNNTGNVLMTINLVNNVFSSVGTNGQPMSTGSSSTGFQVPTNSVFRCPGCTNVVTRGGSNYTAGTITTLNATLSSADANLDTTGSPPTLNILSVAGSAYQHGLVNPGGVNFPDYLGTARPGAGSWDIGAYEFVAGQTPHLYDSIYNMMPTILLALGLTVLIFLAALPLRGAHHGANSPIG